jgi:hypothetical protein
MNNKLFGLSTPFEDASKLDREYQRLSSSSGKKITQDHIDHAINFSLTAWHLADKVFNYSETQNSLKEKGIVDWNAFIERVYRLCPELEICHDLSIIYKHCYNSTAKIVKSAAKVSERGIAKINGVPISKIAKINGVPISQIAKINGVSISSEEKLIVKTTDGIELNFMDIAKAVNTFWQKELESLKA